MWINSWLKFKKKNKERKKKQGMGEISKHSCPPNTQSLAKNRKRKKKKARPQTKKKKKKKQKRKAMCKLLWTWESWSRWTWTGEETPYLMMIRETPNQRTPAPPKKKNLKKVSFSLPDRHFSSLPPPYMIHPCSRSVCWGGFVLYYCHLACEHICLLLQIHIAASQHNPTPHN